MYKHVGVITKKKAENKIELQMMTSVKIFRYKNIKNTDEATQYKKLLAKLSNNRFTKSPYIDNIIGLFAGWKMGHFGESIYKYYDIIILSLCLR